MNIKDLDLARIVVGILLVLKPSLCAQGIVTNDIASPSSLSLVRSDTTNARDDAGYKLKDIASADEEEAIVVVDTAINDASDDHPETTSTIMSDRPAYLRGTSRGLSKTIAVDIPDSLNDIDLQDLIMFVVMVWLLSCVVCCVFRCLCGLCRGRPRAGYAPVGPSPAYARPPAYNPDFRDYGPRYSNYPRSSPSSSSNACRNLLCAACLFECCCRDNQDMDCCEICCCLCVYEMCCRDGP